MKKFVLHEKSYFFLLLFLIFITCFFTFKTKGLFAQNCPEKMQGDANCDNSIDGIDYSLWLNSQCRPSSTQSCATTRADFNNDSNVDDDDYLIWFENRGSNGSSSNTWALVFQNSGFPPNDLMIGGFWAYDLLTKYYRYPKDRVRFITTINDISDKWLALGGIKEFDEYNDPKILSTASDIYGQPTKQNYIEGINWLKNNAIKDDDVIIFSFTHGGSWQKGENKDTDNEYDNDDEFLELGDKDIGLIDYLYDGEFADLIAQIRAKNLFVWLGACHGGGFAWDVVDRVQKSGNVKNLYFMTLITDESNVLIQKVDSINYPKIDFDWPDLYENFFGVLLNGLIGLREENVEGQLVLKVDQPQSRNIDAAFQEVKDCDIDVEALPENIVYQATIGLLDFTEGSKFPMKPAFSCNWSEGSKTSEYPDGQAKLGYMNRENMDFVFHVSSN